MKVDMNKLMGPDYPSAKQFRLHKGPAKKITGFLICLTVLGGTCGSMIYQSMLHNDRASADVLYEETYNPSEINPSFTVQHVGNVTAVDLTPEEGSVTVLTDVGTPLYAALNEDGTLKTVSHKTSLYADYQTTWQETDSLESMSFFNGADGSCSDSYVLKEVWFGQDAASENPSDFLILSVPQADEKADFSGITLTNNPNHPKLSSAAGGYYEADEDGNYVICVRNNDVIRLVFEEKTGQDDTAANIFDYDVSDGGYYLEDDYYHRKNQHATSGQANEKGTIYVDAIESGIHLPENYSGDGPRLAFRRAEIGTDLSEESRDNELDTINVWNYGKQEETPGTGVTKGLAAGVEADGNIRWADGISVPDLFGTGELTGKTVYTDRIFGFRQNGFSKTLSSVTSDSGDHMQNFEVLTDRNGSFTNDFWILDTAPSYGTDGHDPVWGSGSEKTACYQTGDRVPKPLKASVDGLDHNHFFGFSCVEDFTLSPGYTGPLSFFGYSDDDLWVFAAQMDGDGQVMTETVVPVADLGGVHTAAAYYCDLWEKLDPVAYGEEAQNWRLFVYWLERNGESSSCYLDVTIPDTAIIDKRTAGSVVLEAGTSGSDAGRERTFLFDNGTGNQYQGTYNDGTSVTVVSGKPFTIPGDSFISINGITEGTSFTAKEIGMAKVWASADNGYEETDHISRTVDRNNWITFVSAPNAGTLSIGTDADGAPDSGYVIRLTLDDMKSVEISAMDGQNHPVGSRFTDENGQLLITLAAGETLKLYNLPEDALFTLEPETPAGWHVSQILLNDGNTSGSVVTGSFPASVVYRYEENEIQMPQIAMEQSVSGDWLTSDIMLNTGALLSYKITVTNLNDTPMNVTVTDILPDGLNPVTSSFVDATLDGQTVNWDVTVDPFASTELSFTCEVTTTDSGTIENRAQVLINEETVSDSNTVTANIL